MGTWPVTEYIGAGKSAIVFKTNDGRADKAIKILIVS